MKQKTLPPTLNAFVKSFDDDANPIKALDEIRKHTAFLDVCPHINHFTGADAVFEGWNVVSENKGDAFIVIGNGSHRLWWFKAHQKFEDWNDQVVFTFNQIAINEI